MAPVVWRAVIILSHVIELVGEHLQSSPSNTFQQKGDVARVAATFRNNGVFPYR